MKRIAFVYLILCAFVWLVNSSCPKLCDYDDSYTSKKCPESLGDMRYPSAGCHSKELFKPCTTEACEYLYSSGISFARNICKQKWGIMGYCGIGEEFAQKEDKCPHNSEKCFCPCYGCNNNSICEPEAFGEGFESCPHDCRTGGNGICDPGETSYNCETDCPKCGNGKCDHDENSDTCSKDCPKCGNGKCDYYENSHTCPADCPKCGNGICGVSNEMGPEALDFEVLADSPPPVESLDETEFNSSPWKDYITWLDLTSMCEGMPADSGLFVVPKYYIICLRFESYIPLFTLHLIKAAPITGRYATWFPFETTNPKGDKFIFPKQTFSALGGQGYDLGHLNPNGDWDTMLGKRYTFTAINKAPQISQINRVEWSLVEGAVRKLYHGTAPLMIITRVERSATPKFVGYNGAPGKAEIPKSYWKAVYELTPPSSRKQMFCVHQRNERADPLPKAEVMDSDTCVSKWPFLPPSDTKDTALMDEFIKFKREGGGLGGKKVAKITQTPDDPSSFFFSTPSQIKCPSANLYMHISDLKVEFEVDGDEPMDANGVTKRIGELYKEKTLTAKSNSVVKAMADKCFSAMELFLILRCNQDGVAASGLTKAVSTPFMGRKIRGTNLRAAPTTVAPKATSGSPAKKHKPGVTDEVRYSCEKSATPFEIPDSLTSQSLAACFDMFREIKFATQRDDMEITMFLNPVCKKDYDSGIKDKLTEKAM